ncbi:MAG: hypothetical protein ACRENX_10280 [Candidatus Dormibacteria bacterium]
MTLGKQETGAAYMTTRATGVQGLRLFYGARLPLDDADLFVSPGICSAVVRLLTGENNPPRCPEALIRSYPQDQGFSRGRE